MARAPRGAKGSGAAAGGGRKGRRGSSGRKLAGPAKAIKGRTVSSTRWLTRQQSDLYVSEAKRLGYRSRAAFKLAQIDDKFHLLAPGLRVVDLGAAPGGWSQVAVERCGPRARVVGIDLQPVDPVKGASFIQGDLLEPEIPARLKALLDAPVDLVLSDMAAPATGHAPTDHLRVLGLAEAALDFAEVVLAPEGAFVAKVLQGGSERGLLTRLKLGFARVRHVKPAASRQESAELYVVATGFRGPAGGRPTEA